MLLHISHTRNRFTQPFLSFLRSGQRSYSVHSCFRLRSLKDSTRVVKQAGSLGPRKWNSSLVTPSNKDGNAESKNGEVKENDEFKSNSTHASQFKSQLQSHVAQAEPTIKAESETESTLEELSSSQTEAGPTTPSVTQPQSDTGNAHTSPTESDSHASRPVPYSKDQLEGFFNYTAGTWLCNAEEQKRMRHLHFDVDALIEEAVKSTGSSYCTNFRKLDDGIFNRTFEITFDTGQVVLAKLPFPVAGPKHFTTASEVATMHFARTHLYLPVPKVYTWSSSAERSSVKAEYIIMEKIEGIPLDNRWDVAGGSWDCTEKDLQQVVGEFVLAQQIMTHAIFPGMGSMYFANDVPDGIPKIPMELEYQEGAEKVEKEKEKENNPPVDYVLGPSVERRFWRDGRAELKIYRGPWPDFLSYLVSAVDCELEWLRTKAKPHALDSPRYISEEDNSPDKHIELLKKYRKVLPYFVPASGNLRRSVLQNPNFTSHKILAPKSGDVKVLAYQDWQNSFVNVLMNLYETPEFVEYGDGEYIKQPPLDPKAPFPELPGNFEELTEEQKLVAQVEHVQAVRYKLYHDLTAEHNPVLHSCRKHFEPEFCLVPLQWCSKTWEEGLAPLKMLLIKIAETWETIAPGKPCPISFTEEERKACEEQMARLMVRSSLELIANRLGFLADALVDHQFLDEAKKLNKKVLEEVLAQIPEEERENLKKAWPIQEGALSLTAQSCH